MSELKQLKIDIIVHGRFHAFALAGALIAEGHDVLVHTNYPSYFAARFGLPRGNVRSNVIHGVLTRLIARMGKRAERAFEPRFHKMFGRWAAKGVRLDADIVHGFSGVMEEVFQMPRPVNQLRILVRGSAHIIEQSRLLIEEEVRAGASIERPSEWMISREMREYQLADLIVVLSTFARDSFFKNGVPAGRVVFVPMGVNVSIFRPSSEVLAERRKRILSGMPLRVLMTGTFSYRKGAHDLVELAKRTSSFCRFRFVGDRAAEAIRLCDLVGASIEFIDRVPEHQLKQHYSWADLFIFTTIEDGFAAVTLQARAACLPVLATTNSAAPDFIAEGMTGWVLPIRSPEAFTHRLAWCGDNRQELTKMIDHLEKEEVSLTWRRMADKLVACYATRKVLGSTPDPSLAHE